MSNHSTSKITINRLLPQELTLILGAALAVFAVVVAGALISAALPDGASIWLFASSYLAPASVAFAVYWWIAQRV